MSLPTTQPGYSVSGTTLARLPRVESLDRLPRTLQPFFDGITNYLRTIREAIAIAEQLYRESQAAVARTPHE